MPTPSSSRHRPTWRSELSLSTRSISSQSFCSGSDATMVIPAFLMASKISLGPVVGGEALPVMWITRKTLGVRRQSCRAQDNNLASPWLKNNQAAKGHTACAAMVCFIVIGEALESLHTEWQRTMNGLATHAARWDIDIDVATSTAHSIQGRAGPHPDPG